MSVQRSHGKRRPSTPRAGASPLPPGTALAVPMHDAKTGRFVKGNAAHRLRSLKAVAKDVVGLNPAEVVPWLRPYVEMANADARKLVEEHGAAEDTALVRTCEDAAAAQAVFRGLLALGAQGDRAALAEAKAWLREYRQTMLSLKAEARESAKQRRTKRPANIYDALGISAPVETSGESPQPAGAPVASVVVPQDEREDDDQGDDGEQETRVSTPEHEPSATTMPRGRDTAPAAFVTEAPAFTPCPHGTASHVCVACFHARGAGHENRVATGPTMPQQPPGVQVHTTTGRGERT